MLSPKEPVLRDRVLSRMVVNQLRLRKTIHLKITVKPQTPSRMFPHVVLLDNLCRNPQHRGDDHQLVKNGENEARRNEWFTQGYVGKIILKFQHNQRSASLMVEIQAPQQALGASVRAWCFPGSLLNSRIWGTWVNGGGKNQCLVCLLPTWLILCGPNVSFQSPVYLKTQLMD